MLQGEHSAILSTFIKVTFVIKILVLSTFEWPFYTGFTVCIKNIILASMAHNQISSQGRCQLFGVHLNIYEPSCFVCKSSDGSVQTKGIHRLP